MLRISRYIYRQHMFTLAETPSDLEMCTITITALCATLQYSSMHQNSAIRTIHLLILLILAHTALENIYWQFLSQCAARCSMFGISTTIIRLSLRFAVMLRRFSGTFVRYIDYRGY